MSLDKKTAFDAVKLVIFMLVTTLATGLLVVIIGNISFEDTTEYKAEFTNATGVVKGDDVRVAGVKVGTVKDIEIVDRKRALVTFDVNQDAQVTGGTHATIRYRNLVGQRYITLTQQGRPQGELSAGSTIPVSRTQPALDLTVLFNGFKPLFEALSPEDLNQLTTELVDVFQGEGGTVENLLGHTAEVTTTLADRDQVIGELIDNLNETLVTIGDRDTQLTRLIRSLKRLVGGLADDKDALLGSLDDISDLSTETADLVKGVRPPLVRDISQLRRLTRNLDRGRPELDRALQILPIKLNKIGRTAIYGSFFNFYLCELQGRVSVGQIKVPVNYPPSDGLKPERCSLP